MKLEELIAELKKTKQKLENAGIDDRSKINLDILIQELRQKIIFSGFDPLTEISNVQVPEIDNLNSLIQQVGVEIENEQKRTQLLTSVISIAKKGLNVISNPM